MIKYNHQLLDIELNTRLYRNHHKGKGSKLYLDDILTFDIEVTSSWLDENGKIIQYVKGKSNEYWNGLTPLSLPYIWQFSFNDKVYYGREFRDFLNVLDDLNKLGVTCIIWVHNLSYEFAFLSNILTWQTAFAKNPHKPMKAVSNEYPNIEFRCTYMLTRLSLATWGQQIGLPKMVGDLDYNVMRTPLTPLTDKELGYCKRDCEVVYRGILDYLKRYNNQWDIPLTQTGTVRRVVKDLLMSDPEYVSFIKRLVPKTAEEYKRLMQVFAGGYTHANRMYSGQVIEGYIEHYDFASSYPTVMVCEKYPYTPWAIELARTEEEISQLDFDNYAFIFEIEFEDITSTSFNSYIQVAKLSNVKGLFTDNGRLLHADKCTITITEQDYITINNNYDWKKLKVIHAYHSYKKYLPKEFVDYILELYSNKTELKDVQGMEDLYMQSKQYINSMFGMMVTAIVQADVLLNGDTWAIQPLTEALVSSRLDKLRNGNPRERRYFLSYSWGCWVTAYARRNLWKCIESCDRQVLYCDTDSIFVLGEHDFSWYNKEVTEKLKKACEEQNIDFLRTRPKTPKGKEKPLGIFDREDNCTEFITLGAKRYCERREDGKLYLTVSGINKGAVELLDNDINNFHDGFNFDKDAECVSKQLCTYITDQPELTYPDGYKSTYTHGINLRATGYLLTLNDDYGKLIQLMDTVLEDIPESGITKLRGYF